MIAFIKTFNNIPSDTKLSAKEINDQLKEIRSTQINKLNEQGVHHDDIPDDETLQQIDEYLEHLESVIPMEEANIQFARDTSLALRNTKLPYYIVGRFNQWEQEKTSEKEAKRRPKRPERQERQGNQGNIDVVNKGILNCHSFLGLSLISWFLVLSIRNLWYIS